MGRENGPATRGGNSNHGHARSSDAAAAGEKGAFAAANGGANSRARPGSEQVGKAEVTPSAASQFGPPSTAAEHEGNAVPPPLVYVEVNIAPGKPPERLVLREGQTQ